jgi:TPR repeat protein
VAIAAEFRGRVQGDASDTHQLVVCLSPEQSLFSLNVTASPEEFDQHETLYRWLIRTQLKLLQGAVVPDLSGTASSHPQAQYDQGRQFATAGRFKEAADWFRKAADQGHAIAQIDLGSLYFDGRGLAQSDAQALRWWRKAAEQGHVGAQMNVASLIESGRGTKPDSAEAFRWRLKVAESGNPEAQYLVAIHFLKGNGVEKDSTQCAQWALRAAKQCFADAEYVLGLLHEVGEGVQKDMERAKTWFRRAAEHGKADGQLKLRQLEG